MSRYGCASPLLHSTAEWLFSTGCGQADQVRASAFFTVQRKICNFQRSVLKDMLLKNILIYKTAGGLSLKGSYRMKLLT